MSARILEIFSGRKDEAISSPVERLSDREFEIFQLVGQGRGTREIASHLSLSVKTVEVHRANLRRKLNLRTGTEVVHYAIRWMEARSAR
jgi:DNA-binding NarL/FixJ family response regulator